MLLPEGVNPDTVKQDQDIIDMVMSNRNESESYLTSSGYIDEWRTWNDMYRSIPKKKPYTWMSNKFVPIPNSKCETAVSQLIALLFSQPVPFQVKPREQGDEEQAKLTQSLLKYQFDEARVYTEFMSYLRSICIFGTGIAKVSWEYIFEDKIAMQPTSPMGGIMNKLMGGNVGLAPQLQQKIYGCPKLTTKNITDIFPDPQSINIQDSWVIDRLFRTKEYLVNVHKNFPDVYNDKVLLLTDEDGTEDKTGTYDIRSNLGRLEVPTVKRPKGQKPIELNEWHGKYDLDGDGISEQCVFTVANGKYLIRKQSRPYWHSKNPFIKDVYIPALNEFYGIGIPELIEDLSNNVNEIYNQRNDNISLLLNTPFVYKKGSGINTKKLVMAPGSLYGTDENIADSITTIKMDNYTRDSHVHVADMERWMQEVTAVTKLTTGAGGSDINETASGMAMLQRASGERFMVVAKGIEQNGFKELIKFFYQLDYQFVDQEQVISILGEEGLKWIKVPPDAVRRDYDFVPCGIFSMENKSQKSLRLIQFKQVTQNDPAVSQVELDRKIYTALEIGDNPNEIIRTDGQMMEIQMIAQQIAMQKVEEMLQKAGLNPKQMTGQSASKGSNSKVKPGGSASTQFKEGISTGQGQLPPPTPANAGNPGAMP